MTPVCEQLRTAAGLVMKAYADVTKSAWSAVKAALKTVDWERIARMEADRREIQAIGAQQLVEARGWLDQNVQAIYDDLGLTRPNPEAEFYGRILDATTLHRIDTKETR